MKRVIRFSLVIILGALSLSCSKSDPDKKEQPEPVYEFPPYSKVIPPGCTNESYAGKMLDIGVMLPIRAGEGESSSPWVDIGISLAKSAASTIGSKSGEAIMSYIFGTKPDPTATALQKISEQLNEMNKKLDDIRQLADDIMEKLQEIEFNQMNSAYTEQFYRHFSDICKTNLRYYNKLRPDMEMEEIEDVIREWGKLTVDGSPAPDSFSRIYDIIRNFQYTYDGKQCNLLSVFDACVFQTTPFEAEGYDTRDQFRATLAAGMACTAFLSALYFSFDADEYMLDEIVDELDWLEAFLRSGKEPGDRSYNAVIRDEDNIICQLMNARFKLPKKDGVYVRETISGTGWHEGTDLAFLDGDSDISKLKNSQFTLDELTTIQQFFYPGSGRAAEDDVLKILDAYGLVLPAEWLTIKATKLIHREFGPFELIRKYHPNHHRWESGIYILLHLDYSYRIYEGEMEDDMEFGGDTEIWYSAGSYTKVKLHEGFSIKLPSEVLLLAVGIDKMQRY